MIVLTPPIEDRRLVRREARAMGALANSFTKGGGNAIGMMGELLVHRLTGGERVGHVCFSHDIVLPDGLTIDVKTTLASAVPEPHYTARVYGSEKVREKLATKCDVYYFVRCNKNLTFACIIGWLPAREFITRSIWLPRGNVDPSDGKLSFADEYTLPISELNSPDKVLRI
jgi:hypothetical protein